MLGFNRARIARRCRALQAREIIQREGMVTKSKRGQMSHAHPMLRVEQQCRRAFICCWRQLRLEWDTSWDFGAWPARK